MASIRRIHIDIVRIRSQGFRVVGEGFEWQVLLIPETSPYNNGAFIIDLVFPPNYPFSPPNISFRTKIYHPNIDEEGQVYLPSVSAENWRPATRMEDVIQTLVMLISDPDLEHPLRADVAEEFTNDRVRFLKNAEEFTKKNRFAY